MSRIDKALRNKKAFIGFLVAGDPNIQKTEEYILAMAEAGADLIEIGIPFSDPIAEGKVIEAADVRALKAGTTTDCVFDMVTRVRQKTDIPLVFLTYLNPVFSYGYYRFFTRSKQAGIDGIIIPDLPFEEQGELLPFTRENGIDLISLIAPTSDDRIKRIAENASGFIYLVSSMGVTGVRSEIVTDIKSITEKIRSVTDTPVCVGFGISTPEQAAGIAGDADGVIVGSAIVKLIEKHGENAASYLYDYVKEMKTAVSLA